MNFMLCGSLFSVDSLFNCMSGGGTDTADAKKRRPSCSSEFSLLIDKRLDNYPYLLDVENMRVCLIDDTYIFMNTPNFKVNLPPIFTTKDVKGSEMKTVYHPAISAFYIKFVKTTLDSKKTNKLHINLNGSHILLTAYPIFDNKEKTIGCTLLEIPYADVQDVSNI